MTPEALAEAKVLIQIMDKALETWGRTWRFANIQRVIRYDFCTRLRKSLGRCNPHSGQIHLHTILLENGNRALLLETLCHEAAHVTAHHFHGDHIKPHGPEWKHLMRMAGYEPRAVIRESLIVRM